MGLETWMVAGAMATLGLAALAQSAAMAAGIMGHGLPKE